MATWSRQGRVAQQKSIIKEVKRHVRLSHQNDGNTTEKIIQKEKNKKDGGSENLVLRNENQEHFNKNFQAF